MNRRSWLTAVPMLYAAAMVAAIFAGGLVPVAVVGGIVVAAIYTVAGRSRHRRA